MDTRYVQVIALMACDNETLGGSPVGPLSVEWTESEAQQPEERVVTITIGHAESTDYLSVEMGESDARALKDLLVQLFESSPDHLNWRHRN